MMTSLFASLPFLAQDAAPQGGGSGPLIMMVLMFAMMYFLIIRPQRRQRQEHEAKIKSLRSGDKIVTAGGILGTITNVKASTVIVRIAEGVRVELDKGSVATVLSKADEPEEPAAASEEPTVEEKA
jgi:preprotein translocase subunit YajC